jgi:hypothetical protein
VGLENKEDILNTAGFWTLGIVKGTLTVAVPILVASLAVGFMLKVVRVGSSLGGMD